MDKRFKVPVSVLVVVYTVDMQILLLERADHPGYWQSVTGSQESGETLTQTATREVLEETGIDVGEHSLADWAITNRYEIYPEWRHRYAPGVTHNTEHVFGLMLPRPVEVTVSPREHLGFAWVAAADAADRVFSPSNATAIRHLMAGRRKQ